MNRYAMTRPLNAMTALVRAWRRHFTLATTRGAAVRMTTAALGSATALVGTPVWVLLLVIVLGTLLLEVAHLSLTRLPDPWRPAPVDDPADRLLIHLVDLGVGLWGALTTIIAASYIDYRWPGAGWLTWAHPVPLPAGTGYSPLIIWAVMTAGLYYCRYRARRFVTVS